MEILQIQWNIPKNWIKTLIQNTQSTLISNIQNSIIINKSKQEIVEIKCKDYYWHLITNIMHMPKAITPWENIYTNFKSKDSSFWKTILKCPSYVADTLQYKHSNVKLYTEHYLQWMAQKYKDKTR